MTEREAQGQENGMDHRMVNPVYVLRSAFDRIGVRYSDATTLTEAKTMVLEYGMLVVTESILAGKRSISENDKITGFVFAHEWLKAIEKTYDNDWSDLIRKIEINSMVIEDGFGGGSEKSIQAMYKVTELISNSRS